MARTKRKIIRPKQESDNASTNQQSGSTAQSEETHNADKNENSEEINGASRYGASWSIPPAEETNNAWHKSQEIDPIEWDSYSLPLSLDETDENDIDGSVLPRRLNCSADKKKLQCGLFRKDNERETSTYWQTWSPQRLSRDKSSQPEPIISEEQWLEALRFRLNQNEEERRNQKQDGKEEFHSAVEESEEKKKERRREILEVLEKSQPYKDKAAGILSFTKPYSNLHANLVVEELYGINYNDGLITFEQKKPVRMFDSGRWKRTDVQFKTGGISQSYEAKEPRTITHRNHIDENRHQSASAPNPCNRGEQLISRPSKEKYGYLPHFHEGLQSSLAGVFGNSENIEGFLVGGREKLQQIRRELDSHSHARSPDHEIHSEKDFNDHGSVSSCGCEFSSSRSYSPGEVLDNSVFDDSFLDDSLSWMGQDYVPEKKKLFTLWGIDIYEEDIPEDSQSPKPKSGSTDEQDVYTG